MKKFWVIIGVWLAFCLGGVTAGAQATEEETGEAAETTVASMMEFTPVTEIVEGQKNIYAVLKVIDNEYWQELIRGLEDAGEELHCNLYLGGAMDEVSWGVQKKMIRQAARGGADAIILAPADSTKLVAVVHQTRGDGIPVVLVDTILNLDEYDVCYMTDNLQAGAMAAKEMISQLKASGVSAQEEAEVSIQIGSIASQTLIDRLAGINQYWTEYAPETWTIIDEIKCNEGSQEQAQMDAQELLESYPKLRGMFGCNNGSTVGMALALEASGRKDVTAVGFDYSEAIERLIADEEWNAATIVQQQYRMGYEGVAAALELADQEEPELKFVDTGVSSVNHSNYQELEG